MRRIYLSHPFGGRQENREKAAALAKLYEDLWRREGEYDFVIVNPLEYFKDFQDLDDYTILRMATNLMKSCDAVLFAPGWRRSRGCRYEHWQARGMDAYEIPEGVKVA